MLLEEIESLEITTPEKLGFAELTCHACSLILNAEMICFKAVTLNGDSYCFCSTDCLSSYRYESPRTKITESTDAPFIIIKWVPADITTLRKNWSEEECADFLTENAKHIAGRSVELGWQIIEDLLPTEKGK